MKAARWLLFPVLMCAAVGATYATIARGWAPPLASTIVSTILFFVIWGLEHVLPHRPEWNAKDGQRWNDLAHTIFGTGGGAALGNFLTEVTFSALGLWIAHARGGPRVWPSSWPIWAQVAIVVLAADLGRYVQHRLMHQVPWLWPFHALHHSVEHLNVWKTSRSHVVERVTQQIFMFGPLVACGAPDTVLLYYVIPNTFLGMFAHSNADFRLGPLEYVIMGPAAHRLHHSIEIAHGTSNYGSAIVLWDIAFGTYTNPNREPPPAKMGIAGDVTPRGFWAQIIDPFVRR
jgi:sterol desaturase/sphingolipid hydroxylase (fatty acid hydroxylase superfamily)